MEIIFGLIASETNKYAKDKVSNINHYSVIKKSNPEYCKKLIEENKVLVSKREEAIIVTSQVLEKFSFSEFNLDEKTWVTYKLNEYLKEIIFYTELENSYYSKVKDLDELLEIYRGKLDYVVDAYDENEIRRLFNLNQDIISFGSLWRHAEFLEIHRFYIQDLYLRTTFSIANKVECIKDKFVLLFGNGVNFTIAPDQDLGNKNIIEMSLQTEIMKRYNIGHNEVLKLREYYTYIIEWLNDKVKSFGKENIVTFLSGKRVDLDLKHNPHLRDLTEENEYFWYSILGSQMVMKRIIKQDRIKYTDIFIEDWGKIQKVIKSIPQEISIVGYGLFSKCIGAAIHSITCKGKVLPFKLTDSIIQPTIFTTNYDYNLEKSTGLNITHLHGEFYRLINWPEEVISVKNDEEMCKLIFHNYSMALNLGVDGMSKSMNNRFLSLQGAFDKLQNTIEDYENLIICGYSGQNDSHINDIIMSCENIKKVYIAVFRLNTKTENEIMTLKRRLSNMFVNVYRIKNSQAFNINSNRFNRKVVLIDTDEFYKTVFFKIDEKRNYVNQ